MILEGRQVVLRDRRMERANGPRPDAPMLPQVVAVPAGDEIPQFDPVHHKETVLRSRLIPKGDEDDLQIGVGLPQCGAGQPALPIELNLHESPNVELPGGPVDRLDLNGDVAPPLA